MFLKSSKTHWVCSIPVRVTFDESRKHRRYVVSEFLFSPILVLVFIWSLFSDIGLYRGAIVRTGGSHLRIGGAPSAKYSET